LLVLVTVVIIINIIINIFVERHKVVTSEALGPGSVLLNRRKRESPGEEECLQPRLKLRR